MQCNSHSCLLVEISQVTQIGCLSISETKHDHQTQLKTEMVLFSGFEVRPYIGSDHQVTKKLNSEISLSHVRLGNCDSMKVLI